jgi:hypothetical protein
VAQAEHLLCKHKSPEFKPQSHQKEKKEEEEEKKRTLSGGHYSLN